MTRPSSAAPSAQADGAVSDPSQDATSAVRSDDESTKSVPAAKSVSRMPQTTPPQRTGAGLEDPVGADAGYRGAVFDGSCGSVMVRSPARSQVSALEEDREALGGDVDAGDAVPREEQGRAG